MSDDKAQKAQDERVAKQLEEDQIAIAEAERKRQAALDKKKK